MLLLLIQGDSRGYDIALLGRVLVKVTSENGMIKRGDKVMSYINGYAIKCNECKNPFGIAVTEQKKEKEQIIVLLK